MVEKRFDYTNYDDGTESIYDRKKDEYYFDCEFCKLDEVLNELADENEQLKSELGKLNILYKAKCKTEEQLLEMGKEVEKENEQLKQALREQLEENGNAYCIKILDKIFDLKYDEWQRKMNETHTYDYIDWEKVLKDKGDVE